MAQELDELLWVFLFGYPLLLGSQLGKTERLWAGWEMLWQVIPLQGWCALEWQGTP